jgi:hypothetical protein
MMIFLDFFPAQIAPRAAVGAVFQPVVEFGYFLHRLSAPNL